MALALGVRIQREAGKGNIREMAEYGFRLCLSRKPNAKELQNLVRVYHTELARLRNSPADVCELLQAIPGYKPPPGLKPTETAAWFFVASVLLNLDETITQG